VRTDTAFPWTADLVALLALLPAEEVLPLYRARWPQITAREEILPRLAAQPTAADRPKFLAGLGSAQPSIVRTSVVALLKLPPDPSGTNLVAPLKLLHRLASEPAERPLRAQVTMLITNSLKVAFRITEPDSPDPAALRRAYQPIFDYVGAKYPGVLRAMNAEDNDDPVRWNAFWRGVNWENGDPERGEQIFVARACASCHRAEGQIGPDLAGAAQRFAPADLMNAVVFPSREIAPPYRTTAFRLRNGEVYTGMVAFESADGWIVHTGQGSTVRINATDVVSRQSSSISLMPSGLFHGIRPQEVADLFAYLRTLQAR
jgi:putative heme-binding domain-containing protein